MNENEISKVIVSAVYHVYNALGPGLLESVYEKVLAYELEKRGLTIRRQVSIPIIYDHKNFGDGDLRADMIVEDKVIVELKSVLELKDVYYKQLLTYLRLSGLKLGLLVNFDTSDLRGHIRRVVNGL